MEENYSDTEHIIKGKQNDKFQHRIKTLRTLIFILLAFGIGLSIFALIAWNNSSNEILRSLAVTGLVTIFASLVGLYGCKRCLKHLEVIRTTKMKESPGQEALLIFFYFNFVLFCSFLLFGTWCFFYQDDATAWLEAKYTDKESWEKDFKGISLATVENNIKLILTIAGVLSLIVALITFSCIYYSMKISMVFETIHTIIQVQSLVIVLISFLIVYAGAIAQTYYQVPQVSEAEQEFLPQVLICTGISMTLVAFLGFLAAKAESKLGLMSYTAFCVILLLNFLIFSVLLNFGSQDLQSIFEEKCNEVMPFFHKNFFQSFGCMNKYTQNSTDTSALTCDKEQMATIWESNVGIDVEEQSEFYGCLNEKCCIAMISFVKGKFNFLAAFCIVAFFFTLVAIMTSQYMYKKIKKYNTRILSHKNDNTLLMFMVAFTLAFGILIYFSMPTAPKGMPEPDRDLSKIEEDQFFSLYDLSIDRTIGIGFLNLAGWWNFERISLFQTEGSGDSSVKASVTIQSYPTNGEFRLTGTSNETDAQINNAIGQVKINGLISEINQTLSELEFKPGCILDKSNYLELNLTFYKTRLLQNDSGSTIEYGVPKRYKIDLNLNSGVSRTYRAKLIESNPSATGSSNYFKDLTSSSDINVTVSLPFSNKCPSQTVQVNSNGILEFNMTLLNQSIPYALRVNANRKSYNPIVFDYFVGGYPNTHKVEMGSYIFYAPDNKIHNVTGRLFEAFTNKTFEKDYTITVYQGYGELNQTSLTPYETLDYYGNGEYYTGYYELYDLPTGAYVAIVESQGYIKNFQRFYAFQSPPYPKQMRAIPLFENLKGGELSLSLTWAYSPRDLDIHVEFIASPTILCKCDYTMHQCGGVRYMADTIQGGDRGADVIKFDYIGDFQYIVYVSLFKHKSSSPKASNNTNADVSLAESQAQLKVFSPYYSWPVFIFDVPAASASSSQNYWTAFCFSGKQGLKNLVPINQLSSAAPDVSTCQQFYGTPNFFLGSNSTEVSGNGENL